MSADPLTSADPAVAAPPAVLDGLRAARGEWRTRQEARLDVASFPSLAAVERVVADLGAALYPRRLGGYAGAEEREDAFVAARLAAGLATLRAEVAREFGYWQAEASAGFDADQPDTVLRFFAESLADVRRLVDSDVEAAFLGDPAARSVDEILLCYPGAIASLHYRLAHVLYGLGAPIVARLISELANARTGIDIHPGAQIGRAFFIDHGTGVVIGETAVVGERVRLYQHVTLGAHSPLGDAGDVRRDRHARHPIVGDDVVIYAGATLLGRITIGARATIGGNVWLVADVAAGASVVQPEARVHPADRPARQALRLVNE